MKVSYASDLHLEFPENTLYMQRHPLLPKGEVLVLAGDTDVLTEDGYKDNPFWYWAANHFRETLIVCGNHEFYGGRDLGKLPQGCIQEICPNVKIYNNAVVTVGDTDFILTTLWGNIPWDDAYIVQQQVSDFSRIRYNDDRFYALDFNEEHRISRRFLQEAVSQSFRKKVVVTHHVPTMLCCSTEHKRSKLNSAFVTEMHNFIYDSPIDYWVYGHSHSNMTEVEVNGTRIVCNQLGYVGRGDVRSFDREAMFEI